MPGKNILAIQEGAPPRVLVCDDDHVSCAVLKATLQRDQVRADVVYSGDEALDELRRATFDLVILDLDMPELDGFAVLEQIRERMTDLAYLPVILVTGSTSAEARLRGLEAGATDFMSKPFDPAELVARVRNHVGAKRLYDRMMLVNQQLEEERGKIFEAQLELLPSRLPSSAAVRFAAGYRPSSLASGDYYDVIPLASGCFLLAVADVSGHGIASAMHMSILRAVLHSEADAGSSPAQILRSLNRILRHGIDEYSFVTFFLAEYDPATRLLRQASAGHHGALLLDIEEGTVQELPVDAGCPLAVDDEPDYPETEITLPAKSRLLLYTDGIIEEQGPNGTFFELEGLSQAIIASRSLSPQGAVDAVIQSLHAFSQRTRSRDDVTLLVMDVTGR